MLNTREISLSPDLKYNVEKSAIQHGVNFSDMLNIIVSYYYSNYAVHSKKEEEIKPSKERHGISRFRGLLRGASADTLRSEYIKEKYNV